MRIAKYICVVLCGMLLFCGCLKTTKAEAAFLEFYQIEAPVIADEDSEIMFFPQNTIKVAVTFSSENFRVLLTGQKVDKSVQSVSKEIMLNSDKIGSVGTTGAALTIGFFQGNSLPTEGEDLGLNWGVRNFDGTMENFNPTNVTIDASQSIANTNGFGVITYSFWQGEKKLMDLYIDLGASIYIPYRGAFGGLIYSSTTTAQISQARQEGYNQGKADGYSQGKADGMELAETGSFWSLFSAIADVPVKIVYSILDFEFLGVNMKSVFGFLVTVALVMLIIKLIRGSKE